MITASPIAICALSIMLAAVTYSDIRAHRIPNTWVLGGLLAGVSLQIVLGGGEGLLDATGGFVMGLLLFLPFYIFGGMAAGDVKLMSAVGCFLGIKLTVFAAASTLICGGLIAFGYLVYHQGVGEWFARNSMFVRLTFVTGNPLQSYAPPSQAEPAAKRFPYAIAVSTGTLSVLAWDWSLGLPF